MRTVRDNWGQTPTQIEPLNVQLSLHIQADSIYVSSLDGSGQVLETNVIKPSVPNTFSISIDQKNIHSLWFGIEAFGNGVLSAGQSEQKTPSEFLLSQNFPNPFNPSTVINYQLPRTSFVSLKVYDILGKEVATVVNEIKEAGVYSVLFDGSALSAGVYFYKIQAGIYSTIKKMILIK